jgi:hypothetical protein
MMAVDVTTQPCSCSVFPSTDRLSISDHFVTPAVEQASALTQHPIQEDDISVGLGDGSIDELSVR